MAIYIPRFLQEPAMAWQSKDMSHTLYRIVRSYTERPSSLLSFLSPISLFLSYCCCFDVGGPLSLSKAPYETFKLATALIPTLKIERRINPTNKPMKIPVNHQLPFSEPLRS